MIIHNQLIDIGLLTNDKITYIDEYYDFEFNIKTQELWYINDGFGEPEFIARYTRIGDLENAIDLLR
jgi:hypothetical protein